MKLPKCLSLFPLLLVLPCAAQTLPPALLLRLEARSNTLDLVVDSLSETGALFLQKAADLQTLLDSPSLMLQTNTPLTNGLRLPVFPVGGFSNQAFFSAVHWPGRSVDEFGDPEYVPDEPPPAMILLTSGAPTNLASGQTFTVDFFITNPAGELLDITALVAILVLRESDGGLHPDATVSPPTGQMTNGHLRLEITLQSTTPLDGYTLGLGPAFGPALLFGEWDWLRLLSPPPHPLDGFLRTAFNLGPTPLDIPTGEALLQTLNQCRTDNADAGPSWSYPLAGSGHPVSGTFGEWRGKDNSNVHRGLDLAAAAASTVVASRGGAVSHRGTLTGMGDYLVVDHGGGWFSRYLHLNASAISVRVGQAVARGTTLATGLYAVGNWPRHLHFEIRHGADQAQWNVGLPGSGQDPLQTPGIFAVPPGTALPELREFGLTRQHLGANAFVKAPPTANAPGPVYLFAKLLDLEGDRRLGLRAMRCQPEGAAQAVEIRPQADAAIGALLPPGTGGQQGFARYSGAHAASPDPANWYRYWWQWDTSNYADEREGPRPLVLTGEDYSGATADYRFTFGPEVTNSLITPLGGQRYEFTLRAHLGTNTPAALGNATLFVQPDQYKLELIPASGPATALVPDSGPMAGNYTKVFTTHLEEEVYTFTLPGGTSPDGLKLRASSRLAPDIGHEVCFCGGPNMVYIPAGTFVMGSPPTEACRYSDEGPQTTVGISRGFCMGKYEVTQGEYLAVMGSNPSYFQGDLNRPVEQVSWNDVVAYCVALTAGERGAGRLPAGWGYRLPTEAEWEYACRAGTTTVFHYGDALRSGMANFYGLYEYPGCGGSSCYCNNAGGIYLGRTTAVGSYGPNAWGVYDMHGNVWEWCQDWYASLLPGGSVTDPQGPPTGSYRVIRGGGWGGYAFYCRSAYRGDASPTSWYYAFGFRVVLAPGQP